jgi:hypothetical protein
MTFPVNWLYLTQAVWGRAIQTGRPPARNLMSMASACRVAMGDGHDQCLIDTMDGLLGPAVGDNKVVVHRSGHKRLRQPRMIPERRAFGGWQSAIGLVIMELRLHSRRRLQ